jgi:Sortase domain
MAIGGRALLAALALLMATVPAGSATAAPDGSSRRGAGDPVTAPQIAGFHSVRTLDPVAEPVRLRIPAVQVDTQLVQLGRQPDGTIAVPSSPTIAGWYAQGPRPGQPGPAVIIGHVDSASGPGVFFRLYQLSPGAIVYVARADGTTAAFRVVGTSRVPKTNFPTDLVYSPTLQPSLQLVTCGGNFDYRARSYRDNVIVYTVPS